MQEMQVQSVAQEDPLDKAMVFLPGKFHGESHPVGLQSMGLQRVGHNLVTKQQYSCSYNSRKADQLAQGSQLVN